MSDTRNTLNAYPGNKGLSCFGLSFCIEDMAEKSVSVKKSASAIVEIHPLNTLSGGQLDAG